MNIPHDLHEEHNEPPTMYWHRKGCQCEGCQQARLRQYEEKHGHGAVWGTIIVIVVSLIFLGVVMSLFDPHLNFPVISQTVCSLKGDTWYSGGLLGAPGCYAPAG